MTQTIDLPDTRKSKKTAKPKRRTHAFESRQRHARARPKGRFAGLLNLKHDSPPPQAKSEQATTPAKPKRPAPALESRPGQAKARPKGPCPLSDYAAALQVA